MSYVDAVNKAIDFIEERLDHELKMEDIARHAGFSPYHFHRIFQMLTKNTVTDYVRKRRLTHAASELFETKIRIIDLAVKYQFESQEAFTRAFKRMFRIPPGQFRRQTDLKDTTYRLLQKKPLDPQRLSHLQEGVTTEPVYVLRDAFEVVGIQVHSLETTYFGEVWSQFIPRLAEIKHRTNPGKTEFYAVIEPTGVQAEFNYIASVEVDGKAEIPEGMVQKVIPPNRYAIFTHKGAMERIFDTYEYIYGTWLPKSGRTLAEGPEFGLLTERYLGGSNKASEIDLFIPIRIENQSPNLKQNGS